MEKKLKIRRMNYNGWPWLITSTRELVLWKALTVRARLEYFTLDSNSELDCQELNFIKDLSDKNRLYHLDHCKIRSTKRPRDGGYLCNLVRPTRVLKLNEKDSKYLKVLHG